MSAKTTPQRSKLRQLIRDQEDGMTYARRTMRSPTRLLTDWLTHGLTSRRPNTVANRTSLARTHVISELGRRRLFELTAEGA